MNKLRGKFSALLPWYSEKDNKRKSEQLEQITDDFSVKFADFCENNKEANTNKIELLQIFKDYYYGKE